MLMYHTFSPGYSIILITRILFISTIYFTALVYFQSLMLTLRYLIGASRVVHLICVLLLLLRLLVPRCGLCADAGMVPSSLNAPPSNRRGPPGRRRRRLLLRSKRWLRLRSRWLRLRSRRRRPILSPRPGRCHVPRPLLTILRPHQSGRGRVWPGHLLVHPVSVCHHLPLHSLKVPARSS